MINKTQFEKEHTQPTDFSQRAFFVVAEATCEEERPEGADKNLAAVALGRLGGKKGGKARAKKLTPERRGEIATKAAAARWENADK